MKKDPVQVIDSAISSSKDLDGDMVRCGVISEMKRFRAGLDAAVSWIRLECECDRLNAHGEAKCGACRVLSKIARRVKEKT